MKSLTITFLTQRIATFRFGSTSAKCQAGELVLRKNSHIYLALATGEFDSHLTHARRLAMSVVRHSKKTAVFSNNQISYNTNNDLS